MDINVFKESAEILDELSTMFADQSVKDGQVDILSWRNNIQTLRKQLEMAKAGNKNARTNLTPMMRTAYAFVMNFRTALLGSSEEISYRLYVRGEDINTVRVYNLKEKDFLKYVERSGNSLRLKRSLDAIDASYQDKRAEKLFEMHFANISNSLRHVSGNNFVAPIDKVSDITTQYNGHLYWQKSATKKGPHPYTPKKFNRGWIYQAFEATIQKLYETGEEQITPEQFRKEYFLHQLKFDNVVGFKGGDVGLNQIKSNMANLIDITTLIKYLLIIEDILNPAEYNNVTLLKQKILQEFTETGVVSQSMQQALNKGISQLLQGFEKFN